MIFGNKSITQKQNVLSQETSRKRKRSETDDKQTVSKKIRVEKPVCAHRARTPSIIVIDDDDSIDTEVKIEARSPSVIVIDDDDSVEGEIDVGINEFQGSN